MAGPRRAAARGGASRRALGSRDTPALTAGIMTGSGGMAGARRCRAGQSQRGQPRCRGRDRRHTAECVPDLHDGSRFPRLAGPCFRTLGRRTETALKRDGRALAGRPPGMAPHRCSRRPARQEPPAGPVRRAATRRPDPDPGGLGTPGKVRGQLPEEVAPKPEMPDQKACSQPAEPAGRRGDEPAGHLHDHGGFRVGGASPIRSGQPTPPGQARFHDPSGFAVSQHPQPLRIMKPALSRPRLHRQRPRRLCSRTMNEPRNSFQRHFRPPA